MAQEDVGANELMSIEAVQRALNRSRASIYRYANTQTHDLNPPYDLNHLNPEFRANENSPLLFHVNEVARFARDILKVKQVKIEIQESEETLTHRLLNAILEELREIHELLKQDNG